MRLTSVTPPITKKKKTNYFDLTIFMLPVWPPLQNSATVHLVPASAFWTQRWSLDPALFLGGTPSVPESWTGHHTEDLPSAGFRWSQISIQNQLLNLSQDYLSGMKVYPLF